MARNNIDFSVTYVHKSDIGKVSVILPAKHGTAFHLGFSFSQKRWRSREGMNSHFMRVTSTGNQIDVSCTCLAYRTSKTCIHTAVEALFRASTFQIDIRTKI